VRHGANRRVRIVALAALAALLAVGALAAPTGAATAKLQPGDEYVALGSSFASGPLIPDVADASCLRSTNNYPSLVARAMKLQLTDVSCGAATTDNIITTPQGVHPLQIDAVTPNTKLVTVTIGGNDVDYTASNLLCSGDALQGQDCLGTSVQPNDLEAKLAALPGKLDATFAAIKTKAPKATIVVLPYLRVLPAIPAPCPPSVPMSTPVLYYLVDPRQGALRGLVPAEGPRRVRASSTALGPGSGSVDDRARVPPERSGHAGAGGDDPQGAQDQVGPTAVIRPRWPRRPARGTSGSRTP
jgi:hypothetical protein